MIQKIRATETRVVEYIPDYNEAFYKSNEITTLEEAMMSDAEDIKNGTWTVKELGDTVTYDVCFEIVEVDE